MRARPPGSLRGFTLVEVTASLAPAIILILAISVFLADNHKAFNRAYAGAFSSVAQDALAARTIFQKTIRQACSAAGAASVAADGSWIEVRYYSSSGVLSPDRSARFELSGQDLLLRRSVLGTGQTLTLETVCENVDSVEFGLAGSSAQMFLTLDDGTSSQTVNTCAAMRNP
ncbi:MAG: hypothetical protein ABFE13_20470 [Phycisphaerales bacterium]